MTVGRRHVDGPRRARPVFASPDRATDSSLTLLTVAAERDSWFRVDVMPNGDHLPAANDACDLTRGFGASLQVAAEGDPRRVRVHSDTPDAVLTFAAHLRSVEAEKPEGLHSRHRLLVHHRPQPAAIVVDSSVDQPDAGPDRHHIHAVPLPVVLGDVTFPDGVELEPKGFRRKSRLAPEHPPTVRPLRGEFVARSPGTPVAAGEPPGA